jgi:hypothetical protein
MISRAEQREIDGRFNFSKTQWKAILREVNGSTMNLAPFHSQSTGLLTAANFYRDAMSGKTCWLARGKQANAWAKVASLMSDARHAVVDADDENDSMLWFSASAFDHSGKAYAGPAEYLGVSFISDGERSVRRRRILEILEELQDGASMLVALTNDRVSRYGAVERERPRMAFFRRVFRCWTEAGGALEFSRHPKTRNSRSRAPQGPLVRYVQAVTSAVMGNDAPMLETVASLIVREKRLRALDALPVVKFVRDRTKSHN